MQPDKIEILGRKLDNLNQHLQDIETMERLAATPEWQAVAPQIEGARNALMLRVSGPNAPNELMKLSGEVAGVNFMLNLVGDHAARKEQLYKERDRIVKEIERLEKKDQ